MSESGTFEVQVAPADEARAATRHEAPRGAGPDGLRRDSEARESEDRVGSTWDGSFEADLSE
jgi:hypothetical protein